MTAKKADLAALLRTDIADFNAKRHTGMWIGRIDLRGADLSNAALVWARFDGASLTGANLQNADLMDASLSRANMSGCTLNGATITWVEAVRANLQDASLLKADLRRSAFTGASLRRAQMRSADASASDFTEACLFEVSAKSAKFRRSRLIDTDLRGAILHQADLREADFTRARLGDASLDGADLRWANLTSADLRGASLIGADLRYANLSQARVGATNIARCRLGGTLFAGVELAGLTGLETAVHLGRSQCSLDQVRLAAPGSPIEYFLLATGIDQRSVRALASIREGGDEYCGTFISYSSRDRHFVAQLYRSLTSEYGVPCWLDMEGQILAGENIMERVNSGIMHETDKVLVVCSRNSLGDAGSWWVDEEIERALSKERSQARAKPRAPVLIPILLDDFLLGDECTSKWRATLLERRCVDFARWRSRIRNAEAVTELVSALRKDPRPRLPSEASS